MGKPMASHLPAVLPVSVPNLRSSASICGRSRGQLSFLAEFFRKPLGNRPFPLGTTPEKLGKGIGKLGKTAKILGKMVARLGKAAKTLGRIVGQMGTALRKLGTGVFTLGKAAGKLGTGAGELGTALRPLGKLRGKWDVRRKQQGSDKKFCGEGAKFRRNGFLKKVPIVPRLFMECGRSFYEPQQRVNFYRNNFQECFCSK
jgi:hypothetical protein